MALVSAGKTTPARVKGPVPVKRPESGGGNPGSAIISGGASVAELAGSVDEDTDLGDPWFDPDETTLHTAIPQTPLDRPKPTITVQKDTSPEPSPVFQDETPKKMLVLDTPTTNRRPLDDVRVRLATQRRDLDYRMTEDKTGSKTLSVNLVKFSIKMD
ncbi:MAG: hypothetical protein HY318_10720 [Armatimonadetes bacterium]|nr:hypothetical protein [Armatimonadota bacterium]